jgi:hypothetical protein
MNNSGMASGAENAAVKPVTSKKDQLRKALANTNSFIDFIGLVLFRLRKLVLAVPVAYMAMKLARYNLEHLPEEVGINIQSTGEFAQMVARDTAVMGPLGLTAACLLLMFCSRKAMYPWAISVFTLVLPILILVTNLYPA